VDGTDGCEDPGVTRSATALPHGPKGSGVVCGDSREILRQLPSDSVHLILSDIPYGIGLDEWDVLHQNTNSAFLGSSPAQKRAGSVFRRRGKPINGWSRADGFIPREYQDWCAGWAPEWLRVLKPGGSALVFAGRRMAHRCTSALEDAGFNVRDLLSWKRPRATHRAQRLSVIFERRGDLSRASEWQGWRVGNLRPVFEPIIWCFKPYAVTIADNVLEHEVGAFNQTAWERYFPEPENALCCGLERGEGGLHPAQKPLALMRALIELTSRPGHLVVDPFAGSGSTVVAAQELDRRYLAIEQDPRLCDLIASRLQQGRRTPAPRP
jgi:site-specific DNA-methyltransferase (adenine-specific)